MSHLVFCLKLHKEAVGLDFQPMPGALGKKIYDHISKKAWEQWQARQTMIINEYRLQASDPQSRVLLKTEMEKFLFGENANSSAPPPGYVPPESNN